MGNYNSIAISTAWNSNTHSDIREMLSEIRKVGFDKIEVGFNFTTEKLERLPSLINTMDIKVASVHNFCPTPSNTLSQRHPSDSYRFSSLNKAERRKAVDCTKRTIDTACKLSAKVVIIHAGTVDPAEDYTGRLIRLYNEGKVGSEEYVQLKNDLLKIRELRKKPYIDAAIKSLEDILSYALACQIKIGLETRYYPNEIPDIGEINYLLELFFHKGLVYWHDIGHAEVQERLGISSHHSYLEKYSENMLGMHMHDLNGIKDHAAPFSGDFDFSKIAPYMRDDLIRVIEVNTKATPQQLKESLRRLQNFPISK